MKNYYVGFECYDGNNTFVKYQYCNFEVDDLVDLFEQIDDTRSALIQKYGFAILKLIEEEDN